MTSLRRTLILSLAGVAVIGLPCVIGEAQYVTTITPPSTLPTNTPSHYNLIAPIVGQQESNWCWAASGQMDDEYVDPLPAVVQCQEANAVFGPGGADPQAGWSDCCVNPGSNACNAGDGGSNSQYPFTYFQAASPPMTWDQLRYQLWMVNKPVVFAWNWCPCPCTLANGCGAHVMVATGYATDAQSNQWVYINNPEPVGQGDFQCMSYSEWAQDTSSSDPFGWHTTQGDWFGHAYGGSSPQLIYNLATNSNITVNSLTESQAPNLAGAVISDRTVPFSSAAPASASGTIQERVVRETASQTLDFYYRIINSPSSAATVATLSIQDFGRATVAAAWRPDSLGTSGAISATRDVTGSNIEITLQAIPPGGSSHFILLMTNATASNDQGTMQVGTTRQVWWITLHGYSQITTDQPTGITLSAANWPPAAPPCPVVLSQPQAQEVASPQAQPEVVAQGLPKRLGAGESANARSAATAALPPELSKAVVESPLQLAFASLDRLAAYEPNQPATSLIEPSGGLIVPLRVEGTQRLGLFLKPVGAGFIPVGMGQPNMTSLIVQTMQAVAKQNRVAPESLTVFKIPSLFLTFIARPVNNRVYLTPISDHPTYELKAGQEVGAEALFPRLRPYAEHYVASRLISTR